MSSGVKGAIRVSIPSSVKKTIENIKEITGQNHTDDEIYAMLMECSMDPNETAQKLLLLDTFHEVKRKRDRKKENINKEPTESRWKSGIQARANKGSRGHYSSRYTSHDADGGKSSAAVKEIASSDLSLKGVSKAPLATAPEIKKNELNLATSPVTAVPNDPSGTTFQSTYDNHDLAVGDVGQSKTTVNVAPLGVDSSGKVSSPGIGDTNQDQILNSNNSTVSIASASAAASYGSYSDHVLFPSQDLPSPSAVSSIRHEVTTVHAPVEAIADIPAEIKSGSDRISAAEAGSSSLQQNISNELHVGVNNQHVEFLQTVSSTTDMSSVSMPSSYDNNRSQVIGPLKSTNHVAVKEWKPKSTSSSIGQVSTTDVSPAPVINYSQSQPIPIAPSSSEKTTLDLQWKLEESHISDIQHVILPNHLHVPETEKLWFCFGSFDANFQLDKRNNDRRECDQSQSLSESYEAIEESVKELPLSNQNELVVVKDSAIKYPDHSQSLPQAPANFSSSDGQVPPSSIPDCIDSNSKQEIAPGSYQDSADTSTNYNVSFIPPGGQLLPLESSEAQACNAPQLPSFVQSFDPSNYYVQFYRSSMDGDGRVSPFHPVVVANKHAGNPALISAQTSQAPQELQGVVPFVSSNSPPLPLVTQAAGIMQSPITTTQQGPHFFRQPTGVHLPHYPPNYISYAPYYSPFYAPPQAILQFLSNTAFPQQPLASSMYPTPTKYSVSQNKSNTGSSTQIGLPGSYGPYGFSTANYTSSLATAVVSSSANEDVSAVQLKENNIYASGQQIEGSGVWFTTPTRDISTLQAGSFYNLHHGQLAFAPTQPGQGNFAGIFHPAQAVTPASIHHLLQQSQAISSPADMVGPTAHVYQQPQHAQLNWPSNY